MLIILILVSYLIEVDLDGLLVLTFLVMGIELPLNFFFTSDCYYVSTVSPLLDVAPPFPVYSSYNSFAAYRYF